MTMKIITQIACAAVAVWAAHAAPAGELETARAALHDRLYPVAQAHAEKAMAAGAGAEAGQALLVLLEALAGQERYADILTRLDATDIAVLRAAPAGAPAYWRALALLRTGRPQDAARAAEELAGAMPVYADAVRRIAARAKRESGDVQGALMMFAEVDRGSASLQTRAENALEWAALLEQAGRLDAAADVLKMQSELGVTGDAVNDGALLRGRLLTRLGKNAEAHLLFTRLSMDERMSEPARVQALVELSVYALDGGKTNEAVAYARSAHSRAKAPDTRRLAGFRLGDLLCADAATIDEGEALVKALVREFPEHPASMHAQLKLADALLQARRPERAASEYRIFLETYPSSSLDATVLQGRGWALMQLGRYAEAGGVFRRAAQAATNDAVKAECLFKQGDALQADGGHGEAARVYAELAEAYPQDALADRALLQSADCLARAGLGAEAAERYRKVAKTWPDREVAPRALLGLAALLDKADDIDGAVRAYTAVIDAYSQKPMRVDAFMARGKTHYRAYRFESAMQDFATVAESAPERRDEARFMITLCLYGLGRDQEARAAATAFLLDFPESAHLSDMVLWLGKLEFNRGRREEARRLFLDYAARWPGDRWADAAVLWAARAAFAGNDFTGTIELVTRLVRAYPQSTRLTEALFVQADALMELARFDEAVLLLDQVLAKAPESEWARLALSRKGDCLFALGAGNGARYREALGVYRKMLEREGLAPSPALRLHFQAGRCLEKLKQVDDAIDQYYAEVVIRYLDERAQGTWYDERSAGLFLRAAFAVADLHEQKGQSAQAALVLQRVVQAGVPGAEEARQRMERLIKGKRAGES